MGKPWELTDKRKTLQGATCLALELSLLPANVSEVKDLPAEAKKKKRKRKKSTGWTKKDLRRSLGSQ